MKKIPVCVPKTPEHAAQYVNSIIEANWIGSAVGDPRWDYITRLEQAFASYCGVKYAVTVTSGTTALRLSWAVLNLRPGDEVIIPDLTMIAVASTLVEAGITPVFADVGEDDWCIDPVQVESLITSKTRAIVAAHSYGQPPRLDVLRAIADEHDLFLVEDAAQGLGATCLNQPAGSYGDIGCFSLYANKLVSCGEGGVLVTNNREFAERARMLKDHAFTSQRFHHEELGFNFRLNNLSAAYAYASFEEIEKSLAAKLKLARIYHDNLSDLDGLHLPASFKDRQSSYWMFAVLIDEQVTGIDRDELAAKLIGQYGVETRTFFLPMHVQPSLQQFARHTNPISKKLSLRGIYLPSAVTLSLDDINHVTESLQQVLQEV